jgi:hypothetical protein
MNIPNFAALDPPPELRLLRAWVMDPSMPMVDTAAFYQVFFDTVLGRNIFYHDGLYSLAERMAHSDWLYGNNTLSQSAKDYLEQLICKAGHAVYTQWQQAKLNNPRGEPLYRFREYRDDNILLFERRITEDVS